MAKHKIALIPGDGIGKETVPEGVRVLEAAARRFNFQLEFTDFDWSCDRLLKTGKMMPEDGMEQLKAFESIFLGAVGWPGVPDHVSLWGLLIPIRRDFDEYVNLRPVRLFEGVPSPLANRKPGDIDFWVVRENTEGEYSTLGGRMFQGTENEFAVQEAVFTRKGVDRVMKFAFEFARTTKKKHVTSATKSNGIIHTMPFWDERFAEMKKNYPEIRADQYHIDILTAHFVRNPDWFDVVVGSNLFGDILSDLGPALTGSIARHCRQGDRQSDRPDLVGRHDGPPSRLSAGGRGDRAGDCCVFGRRRPADAGPGRQWRHQDRGRSYCRACEDSVAI